MKGITNKETNVPRSSMPSSIKTNLWEVRKKSARHLLRRHTAKQRFGIAQALLGRSQN